MIEGIAAIAVAMLLLVVMTQIISVVMAKSATEAAVAGAARRAARMPLPAPSIRTSLLETLDATVPGSRTIDVEIRTDASLVQVDARVEVIPPGPRWGSAVVSARSQAVRQDD